MKAKHVFLTVLVAVVAAWGTVKLMSPAGSGGQGAHKETAYERVMRTGTIRCGYYLFAPNSMKDPKTGELSGIFVNTFNKMAENMHLKVVWAEEVSFAGMVPGLQTGRYDAICTPMWPTASFARELEFVRPQYYAALGVWVRKDDNRFTNNLSALNDPSVTISGVDGQIEQAVHDEQFPKSKMLSLPGGTDFSQSMLNVATKKADVTFVDAAAGALFEQAHPRLLKNIAADHPLRVFPFSIAVLGGETRLKNMLDVAVQEIINTGYIERQLAQYDPHRYFLPVSKPYELK